ncbi:hypothetical protein QFC19_002961 [Naganishia cerealis]|uniref:Uncharacterized protein n=1 Tax=Naganishia cerealis TaxID=610337 RepID=A0ACC2W600_9TREE|nr:hypothetical protein QFC19_002961 [Naganishia cerealis]
MSQAHRERSLKQLFGSPAYLQALQRKKEWRRWSKFVKGVQVPLGLRFGDVGGREEVYEKEEWKERGERLLACARGIVQRSSLPPNSNRGTAGGAIVRLLQYGSSRREAPSNNTLSTTSSAGTRSSASTGTPEVPRSIRRIYERMLARVPVLRCAAVGTGADTVTEVEMGKQKRKGRGTEIGADTTGIRRDAGWSLAGHTAWIPPRASEEEMRWILGK